MAIRVLTKTTCSLRSSLLFVVLTFMTVFNEHKVQTYRYEHYRYNEEELRANITSFVAQFASGIKRDVITTQLLVCPYTPMCNFSFGLDILPGYELNCEPCRCDIDCMAAKTCCPDIVPDWMYDEAIGQSDYMDDMDDGDDNGEICLMDVGNVHTVCPSNDTVNSRNCTYGYEFDQPVTMYSIENILSMLQMTDIMEIVPVTNKKDGRTFLNRHCAQCYTDDLELWDTYITCAPDQYNPDTTYSLKYVLSYLYMPGCKLEFRSPNFKVSACSPVSTCSDKNAENKFKIGCSLYESTVTHRHNGLIFKNINCLACNGLSPIDAGSLKAVTDDLGGPSFVGKLNYAEFTRDTDRDANMIPPFYLDFSTTCLYDEIMNNCFDAICPPLTVRAEKTCRDLFTEVNRTVYESYVIFTSNSPMVLENSEELDHVYDILLEAIENYEEYLENRFGFNHTIKKRDIYAHNRHENVAQWYPLTVTDVSIQLYFYFDVMHPVSHPIEIMTNMDHLSQLECSIHLNESVSRHNSDFTLSVQIMKDYRFRWAWGYGSMARTAVDDIPRILFDLNRRLLHVVQLKPCVFVRVCEDDGSLNGTAIQWNETWNGLLFPTYGQTVQAPEFYYTLSDIGYNVCIRICLETLHRVITSTPPENVLGIAGNGAGCCFRLRVLFLCLIRLLILTLCTDS